MKALVCVEHGPPEKLVIQDQPTPEPGKGEVRIRMHAAGEIPKLPLNLPLIKGASIVGVFWGAFTQHESKLHAENMAELLKWFAEGKLKPHVSAHLPLERGAEAIRMLMDRKAKGKVILTA